MTIEGKESTLVSYVEVAAVLCGRIVDWMLETPIGVLVSKEKNRGLLPITTTSDLVAREEALT
eukprot:CAMPEP_0176143496 /NCGR_PEP_ID=MMETSP0120_2-20121206/73042_1 /TAXON_ID=160619 /ORGANISM="Kryptoperidinium foliaceum, Strain CCMP 1326" /LENGTH=62 /DNA_ID=CAMNT_0017479817 /DNA_START=110 /DNA_END=298 /DNA_ORIENTATION=+